MEGFSEAMQQEGKPSSHEKAKRKLKTPAQLEALEKFYNENKYPTEAMKLEFAKEIGLSEKQISGWFCHRRLKEKKVLQGEICTNEKQNLSSSVIHDRTSGVKQESCSSTKQVDRNLDSKEVESKMYYGYNSSFGVLAYEVSNKYAHAGHNHVMEDSSPGSTSASRGGYIQPSRCNSWKNTSMLMCNKNIGIESKSKENMMKLRCSFLQDEINTPAISALKWKLGRHYREDGPPLGFEFDPLPPGSFNSPVRDSKCEPYYVGDSMEHNSSSFCRTINETRVYNKYGMENFPSNAYDDQRSFRSLNPGIMDCSETSILHSAQKTFIPHHNHLQYQPISIGDTEKFMSQTSCLSGRNNLRCFRTAGECDDQAGYNYHQHSLTYPNHDSPDFQGKIRKENSRRKHCMFQPEMLINNKTKSAEAWSNVEFRQQQFAGKCFASPAGRPPFMRSYNPRNSFCAGSNLQDVSGDASSSLD